MTPTAAPLVACGVTILVTGATGFIGSALVRQLCQCGDEVRVLVRPTSDRRRIAGLPVEVVAGDVRDRDAVAKALDGIETVYHAAAVYEIGTADARTMEDVNVGGTRNVLQEAAARSILTVYVSSAAALGPTGPDAADESHWVGGAARSVYEATKHTAHEIALDVARGGGRVRIAAPVTVFGPDDPSMIGSVYRLLTRGLPVAARARMQLALVHVEDCARGLVAVAHQGRDGEVYLLAGGVVAVRAWCELVASAAGVAPPRAYLADALVDGAGRCGTYLAPTRHLRRLSSEATAMSSGVHWAFSEEKARRELGWEPRPLKAAIQEVAMQYVQRRGDAVGFSFHEVMAGTARREGDTAERAFRFDFMVTAPSLKDLATSVCAGTCGTVTLDGLARDAPAEGTLDMSPIGGRCLRYSFSFTGDDGQRYSFDGFKTIDSFHLFRSWTTLPGTVYDGAGRPWAAARLRFSVRRDLADLVSSVRFHRGPRPGAARPRPARHV